MNLSETRDTKSYLIKHDSYVFVWLSPQMNLVVVTQYARRKDTYAILALL